MIEMLVGLKVTNDTDYSNYRAAMTPLLESIGGSFGYDFKVAEVLISQTENEINRVFTIRFPSDEKMNAFFTNEEYLKIKKEFFEHSVASTTILATYTT